MRKAFKRSSPITAAQVTAIGMGRNALKISDDDYYTTLWVRYAATSCKDLTQEQASDLIEDYISRGFVLVQSAAKAKRHQKQKHPVPPRRPPEHGLNTSRPVIPREGNVVALAKPEEIDKVNAVAALIPWREENGLELFLEKRMGLKGGRIRTSADAYLAIEGLKKMFENGMKKAYGPDWWTRVYTTPEINEYIRRHCPEEYR